MVVPALLDRIDAVRGPDPTSLSRLICHGRVWIGAGPVEPSPSEASPFVKDVAFDQDSAQMTAMVVQILARSRATRIRQSRGAWPYALMALAGLLAALALAIFKF
jgi:hypothetical protein